MYKRVMTLLFAFLLMFFVHISYGQDVQFKNAYPTVARGIGLTTFSLIAMSLCIFSVEVMKLFEVIRNSPFLKILISTLVGVTFVCTTWFLGVEFFLDELNFWQAALQGVITGLAASGLYDLCKTLFTFIKHKS